MDSELADAYYLEHRTNSNETLVICTPHIPLRSDKRKKMIELTNNIYSVVRCDIYKLGYYKLLHEQGQWSYMLSSDYPLVSRIYLIIAYVTAATGIIGKY